MRLMRSLTACLCALALVTLMATGAGATGGRPFSTHLLGANEFPVTGDPDASGTAHVWINPGQGSVCWMITVSNVDPIFAAHIHIASPGSPGPIVVPLNPYTGGCGTVDRDLALAIVTNPSAYYVNVHTVPFPGGAARGQLSRTP